MEPTYSIIVVSRDKADYTRICLASVLLTTVRDFEVIVVDNGSTDGSADVIRSFAKTCRIEGVRCRTLWNVTNLGAVVARNQALEEMTGNFVVFLDNDAFVKDPDWLAKIRARLDADPQRGIISPKLLFPFLPYNIECAGCAVSSEGRVSYLGRGSHRYDPEYTDEKIVQCAISACWMTRREVFDAVGFLDEAYSPVQFEDIDFCYRVRERGWQIIYTPAVEMFHFENVTTEGSPDLNLGYLTIRNGMKFKRRWSHVYSQEDGPQKAMMGWERILHVTATKVFGEALEDNERLADMLRELSLV